MVFTKENIGKIYLQEISNWTKSEHDSHMIKTKNIS